MNRSQRIKVDLNTINEKFIKLNLQQDVDYLEILSLKLDQKDIYQSFNSDYGVLIGRVLANGGVGIPNAKISVFIPITDEDKLNSDIFALYPYEQPYNKNLDGKRYNLLPRVSKEEPVTGVFKPRQPFGSFPIKEEVLANETFLEVYKKYYKYSTVTNSSGDYMLFGVPVGVQTVHMSVDITDIGEYSMSPFDMIYQLGYSSNLFTTDGKIKPQIDLDDLPHIETQEISVEVVPFWGDTENFEIGITRQDFRIRAQLVSNFYVFGSYFTMGRISVNGTPDGISQKDVGFYILGKDYPEYNNAVDVRTNRVNNININVYYYPATIDEQIIIDDIQFSGSTINPQSDIIPLDENSYFKYVNNGEFLLSIPCNRKKVITDEFGNKVETDLDDPNGIFTEFLGMIFFEDSESTIEKTYEEKWIGPHTPNNTRLRFKIPQDVYSLREEENIYPEKKVEADIWRKKYFKFQGSKYYSIAQFFAMRNPRDGVDENPDDTGSANSFYKESSTTIQDQLGRIIGAFRVGGESLLTQSDVDNINDLFGGTGMTTGGNPTPIFLYDFPWTFSAKTSGGIVDNGSDVVSYYFGGQWLNFSMYFPQINWTFDFTSNAARDQNTADLWFFNYRDGTGGNGGEWFTPVGNSKTQFLVGGTFGTTNMGRADSFATDFVEVPLEDISKFASVDRKGVTKYDLSGQSINLVGNYKYRTPPATSNQVDRFNQRANFINEAFDIRYYNGDYTENPMFFKGMYNANCIDLLFNLNFI